MLFKTALITAISWLVLSSDVIADSEESLFYLELGVGGAINSDKQSSTEVDTPPSVKAKHQTAAITSLSFIYQCYPDMRFAWNFSYLPKWRASVNNTANEVHSYYHADLSSLATTLNGYYDIINLSVDNVTPYIMAGAGVSSNQVGNVEEYVSSELSSKFYGNSNFNFTWRLGAGLNYKINERAFINLGYNFASLGGVRTKISSTAVTNSKIESMVLGNDRLSFKKIHSHQFLISLGVSF